MNVLTDAQLLTPDELLAIAERAMDRAGLARTSMEQELIDVCHRRSREIRIRMRIEPPT